MAQESGNQPKVISMRPGISRFQRWIADIFLTTWIALAAFPVAKLGVGDSILVMLIVFYSILFFVVGFREYTAILLGLNAAPEGPPPLTLIKSLLVVATFIAALLSAAWAISWLSVSDRIRVVLLFGTAALVWTLFGRLGPPWLCFAGPTSCEK